MIDDSRVKNSLRTLVVICLRLLCLVFLASTHVASIAAQESESSLIGTYTLSLEGLRLASTGKLEVVGEAGDYFGRLTLDSEPPRVYSVGLAMATPDSVLFTLPGNGRLVLRPDDQGWNGDFSYFRLRASLKAEAVGAPPEELLSLVELKPFGWGTLSTQAQETFPTLSADGKSLYFTRDEAIMVSQRQGDGWSEPEPASFSGEHNDSAPYFAPDSESLLFTSNRPNPDHEIGPDQQRKKDLWITHQDSDGKWSTPMPLPSPVNVDSLGEYHGALANDGIVYFVSYNRPGGYGRSDLYRAVPEGESYRIENLGPTVNTEASEADVYVEPNERFVLVVATDLPGSYGADDIYVCYGRDQAWTPPKNLGASVNSFAYEYAPWIDFREGYLYFTSFRRGSADLYRVALSELELE